MRLLQKLKHPNIVAFKDSFLDRDHYLNLIMSYCEEGDIYSKYKNNSNNPFSEEIILGWLAQMLLAIHYLHDLKILHRDLKSQNIFIKQGILRVGDFGIAKVLENTRDFANTVIINSV